MTGAELPVAAAAAKAAKSILDDGKSTKKELLKKAKDTPEFAEGARQLAVRVAIRQEILTSFYKPIAKLFGVAHDYFENDFEKEMAEKLVNVPEENLVAPKASLAAPAMQQLGFSLDEPDLKEMYLNLLATASDDRYRSSAHPSFVEVIKQLTSEETPLLGNILTDCDVYTEIVTVTLESRPLGSWRNLHRHVLNVNDETTGQPIVVPHTATYVDNWLRLGLVEVSYSTYASTAAGAYSWIYERPEYKALRTKLDLEVNYLHYDAGVISPSAYGIAFGRAVGIIE